jgi:hypothetical protein
MYQIKQYIYKIYKIISIDVKLICIFWWNGSFFLSLFSKSWYFLLYYKYRSRLRIL